jgi:hypothetical protein
MGKVTIEFDSAEEQEDIQSAINGYKWKLSVWDIDQHLRGIEKYNIGDPTDKELELVEKLREEVRNILHGYGLIMD